MIKSFNEIKGTGKKIKAGKMKPLQVGIITDKNSSHKGEVVMRTARTDSIEIISISRAGEGHCWCDNPSDEREITLLGKDETFIVALSN
jgi:hypothetical protein